MLQKQIRNIFAQNPGLFFPWLIVVTWRRWKQSIISRHTPHNPSKCWDRRDSDMLNNNKHLGIEAWISYFNMYLYNLSIPTSNIYRTRPVWKVTTLASIIPTFSFIPFVVSFLIEEQQLTYCEMKKIEWYKYNSSFAMFQIWLCYLKCCIDNEPGSFSYCIFINVHNPPSFILLFTDVH